MARKPSTDRNYFTKETDEWIVKYNNCEDVEEKNRIFTEHIYYPFYKLAENIINTWKFYHTDVEKIEDLKLDIVTMLVTEKIQRFDPSTGAKAFSYFGTIVKRWLIAYNNKNYTRKKNSVPASYYEDYFSESQDDIDLGSNISLSNFIDQWVDECYENLDVHFTKEAEKQVADAILTVFRTRKDLEIIKKKAFYLYIREITGYDTPFITKVLTFLKEDFYKKYQIYLDKGLISFESD